uniref:Pco090715 n=1 Tax=Arundo donax TaxID=35708 RepID=A0A0A9D6E6_ARUDO
MRPCLSARSWPRSQLSRKRCKISELITLYLGSGVVQSSRNPISCSWLAFWYLFARFQCAGRFKQVIVF